MVLMAIGSSGCSMRTLVATHMGDTIQDMNTAFMQEPSVKEAREAAPAMLKMLDGFIVSAPEDKGLLQAGAQMNCGFSMLLIEDEDPQWASKLYKKGLNYALRGLELDRRGIKGMVEKGDVDALKRNLKELDRDDLPLIFWAGECMAGWINLNLDDPEAMSDLPVALAFVNRAKEIDDTYFYGGPHMVLAVYYGTVGKAVGGDPEKSRAEFEKVFKITKNQFMLAKFMYAKTYCVQTQNKAEFEKALNEVLDFDVDQAPDFRLINEVAKIKAEKLLDQEQDKFIQ